MTIWIRVWGSKSARLMNFIVLPLVGGGCRCIVTIRYANQYPTTTGGFLGTVNWDLKSTDFCHTKSSSETTQPLSRMPPRRDCEVSRTDFAPQSLRLRHAEHSTPQQINVGPAKHLPLEHLQPVDVTLHRTRTPRQRHPSFHCLIVLA